ncbi:MAG: nucleotidyltransferase domain-containing protein, partial [Candidatus Omnitrophica bacterium]|nr:nucleotidyltransferase domain-containing protein [Candidatus Omnitrophota bacterium]
MTRLPHLPKRQQRAIDDFTLFLKRTYGEGLISVVLYGSAASGKFSERYSNLNLLIVLDDASPENLKKIAPLLNTKRFRAFNMIVLTEEFILSSTDVFPIDFLDMKEKHVLLYGRDLLSGLEIDISNLRFQCEHELKSHLISMKRTYLHGQS